ncbi:MAG: acyltransferase domain-containing protein [Clostridiaceae bacterium]
MNNELDYIISFCDEFGYPAEAKAAIISAYKLLSQNSCACESFQKYVLMYNGDRLNDFSAVFDDLDAAADLCKVHKYTLHLLLFICLSKHTRELYERKGISYEIFHDSMSDLKWKLTECYNMYGIWGSFVSRWFPGFFILTRFGLGRLQFEIVNFKENYKKGNYTLKENDTAINIHIPACGPLLHDECIASYHKAADFFKDYFAGRPVAFVCTSWLLFPYHKEFFPKSSNILKFMEDFDIYSYKIDNEGADLWRIFYKDYRNDPADLPNKTSIQRAYADWLMKGNPVGYGKGVFFIDGGKIVHN